jgi:hypothetical protein
MIVTGRTAWTGAAGTLLGVKEGQADGQDVRLLF